MALSLVILGLAVIVLVGLVLLKWNDLRYNGSKGLPPGRFGLPLVGETLSFLKQGPSFMSRKKSRYGSLFKTHILGSPAVISMDPDLNRYILLNESKGLVPGYPQSHLRILGKANIATVVGATHKRIRGAFLSLVGPPMMKQSLLYKVDRDMRSFTDQWEGKTLDIQEKTKEMGFFIAFKHAVEAEFTSIYEPFQQEFNKLAKATLSLPINMPGTQYYRGIQARENVINMLGKIVNARRASPSARDDMLHYLMNDEGGSNLTDEEIFDQIITLLYSSYETVSTTSMMALKYLSEHPSALQELREEHLAIREGKGPEKALDWGDYKSMRFTRAVVMETSRLATIVNGVMRKTTTEMELNGFLIPKGWMMYVYTRESNYDPLLYPEPFSFNPWRWTVDNNLESNNYCFLFGGGTRLCPGKELGIVQVTIFLHHVATRYRWEKVGKNPVNIFPRVEAPKGLHIKVAKYE